MINRERINDRGKLLYHRLVARKLAQNPDLIDRARSKVEEWIGTDACTAPVYAKRWQRLLAQDLSLVRRQLVSRSEEMVWLRSASPFGVLEDFMIADVERRRKLWRIASRGIRREHDDSGPNSNVWPARSPGISVRARSS